MKNLLNRKLFELFELFDKKARNYSLFDKFLNPYLNPSLLPVRVHCTGSIPHDVIHHYVVFWWLFGGFGGSGV
jgi:hypothetical protein